MKPSVVFLVASQIISTGLKFVFFVILTSEGGLAVAGSYTLGLAITTPTFLLFNLGLREIYVTAEGTGLVFQRVLFMRGVYGLVGVFAASCVAIILFPENFVLVFWMSLYRYTEVLLDIVVAYFQRKTSALGMAVLSIAYSLVTISFMAVSFLTTQDLVFSVMVASFVGLIVFVSALLAARPWHPGVSLFPSKQQVWTSFRQGSMLSLSSFAVSLGTNIPVLFIESFHSTEQVGFYSAIYHITTASNILYGSIAQLELRRFAVAVHELSYAKFQNRWKMVTGVLTLVGLAGAAVVAVFGLPIFEFVFDQDFTPVYPALLVMGLVICATPAGFLLDTQLVALQKYSVQSTVSLAALCVTVLVSSILIPLLGVLGGVIVVLSTLVFRNVIKYLVVKREIERRLSQ